jgi:hypothetical protein
MTQLIVTDGQIFSSNGGDSAELKLAASVAAVAAALYREPTESFFIADHTHEELPKGSALVAWEGGDFDYGWTVDFTGNQPEAQEIARSLGVFLEPINSVILGIYPVKD